MHKNNTHYKIWRKGLILSATFLLTISIFSCKKEQSEVGSNINPNSLNVITTDTFTLKTYSDELDSMTSDETSISLLGGINDPEFGKVDCGIVTQIRLSTEAPDFGNISDITVDSVVLSFVYSGIKFYGNLDALSFEVYEITDELIRDDQEYYTFTPVNTTGGNLIVPGEENIIPKPITDVTVGEDTLKPQLRLKLNPSFGDYLLANVSSMNTNENFVSFFKGFYIKVSGTSSLNSGKGGVLYFALEDVLSNMVLYYHNSTENNLKFTFNINSRCARFNKIDYDRTSTAVESILNNPELGQQKFYMQGSSIRAMVEVPYLMDLVKDKKRIINKAELYLVVQDFQQDVFNPSTSLFISKPSSKYVSDFTKDYPTFSFVNYNESEKHFRFLITQEVQAILNGEKENNGFRFYPPSFFGSSIERIIFSGGDSEFKNKTRLVITYTEY